MIYLVTKPAVTQVQVSTHFTFFGFTCNIISLVSDKRHIFQDAVKILFFKLLQDIINQQYSNDNDNNNPRIKIHFCTEACSHII